MAFFESNYPTAEPGTVNAAGTFSVNGQEFSQTAQVQVGRASAAGNVVAVRVGRRRAVIGTGGFFAARTTHEEP
jgi:hypothetical protein